MCPIMAIILQNHQRHLKILLNPNDVESISESEIDLGTQDIIRTLNRIKIVDTVCLTTPSKSNSRN